MPDAAFYDGNSGKANINIEFGFDANDANRPPAYKQDFTFSIPNGVDNFVFTTEFCIAEKGTTFKLETSFYSYSANWPFPPPDNSGNKLACYRSEEVNFQPSSNPYITTGWKGIAPNPPSVKGGRQTRLGTYDANLEASNIFNDQETDSPDWIQTPDDNANSIDRAFAFPNPYPIPEDPWA